MARAAQAGLPASDLFVRAVQALPPPPQDADSYVFSLPVVRHLGKGAFTRRVTLLVGENGTGKSTLLEALACHCGFNAEGGSRNFNFATRDTTAPLYRALRVTRGARRPRDGFFLRAESFYNVASEVDRLDAEGPPGLLERYGGRSLHAQSHGESFLALILHRFGPQGLYLLDEPEAALSPARQMTLLYRIHQLSQKGCQFIIATHSPMLMTLPDADIWLLEASGIRHVPYTETEHYQLMRAFLDQPQRMLKTLLADD